VRAAAVTALAKFGAQCAELRPSIQVLLKRCLLDSDDEVRDRATFYLALLADATVPIINTFVLDSLQVLPSSLERCLFEYVRGDSFNTPFDLRVVPVTSQPLSLPEKRAPVLADVPVEKPAVKKEPYAEQLAQIPEFASLGPLFHSSPRVALTDDVTEYTVHAIKHIFTNHVVVQLDCKNTLNDQLLENVTVELEDGEGEWTTEHVIPIDNLPYNETKSTYVLMEFPESGSVTGNFAATLKFNVKDVDPTTGEAESDDTYEDSYVLEELEIAVGDLVAPVVKQNFMASWEALEGATTVDETFHLTTVNTLAEAIKKVSELLGMAPCERSDRVPEGKTQHSTMLAGVFRGGFEVL
ncbi:coatomer gamma subunit appendage domain protein, partial [Ostertagia ostertagi]